MSITDELREWAEDNTLQDMVLTTYPPQHAVHGVLETLLRIADRIDAEHEKAIHELNGLAEDSVLLPRDADGEYIHVGDVMDGYGKTIEVVELRHGRSGWVLISRDGNGYADTFAFTHHHAPTVEDVLREMLYKAHIYDEREMELLPDLIAKYAKRLTLRAEVDG